jgi:hypothetical protein
MLFDDAWHKLQSNRNNEINAIPFGFKKFEQYLPGILKKHYYILTANAGVGKSQITDFMFLYQPFNYWLQHKDKFDIEIHYFSLEMDRESKIIAGMAKRLYEEHRLRVSPTQLLSFNRNKLPAHIFDAVYKTREYFELLSSKVKFYDDQMTPTHINDIVQKYAKENGKEVTRTVDGHVYFDKYIPNNPNKFVIFITDHLAELDLERGLDLKGTIERHSDNNRKNRNKYGFTFIDVQQQMAAKEDQEFYQGLSIITKLEPSLHGLGESKLTQRKANIVLGLFAPNRFEIPEYRGYNIKALQDNFRSLSILKNRNGVSNVHTGLYFDGATNYFEELPRGTEMTTAFYEELRKRTKD